MRMGNLLSVWGRPVGMAVQPGPGIAHLTVVPTNYEPEPEADADSEAEPDPDPDSESEPEEPAPRTG